MSKIKSLEELKKIKEQAKSNTELRTTGESPDRIVLKVGMATCGIAAGARTAMTALLDEISKQKLENISVIGTGCIGMCYAEPIVEVLIPRQELIRYGHVDDKRAREIISQHVINGTMLDNAIVGREVPNNG